MTVLWTCNRALLVVNSLDIQVTVDGQHQGAFMLPDKSYWSVTLSNLPLPGDTCIANPGFD